MVMFGSAAFAMCMAFVLGLFYLKRLRIIRAAGAQASPSFIQDASATPLWAAGIVAWMLFPNSQLENDRFYDLATALAIGKCVFIGAVALAVFPSVFSLRMSPRGRMITRLVAELLMAVVAVWQGIRFEVMSAPGTAEGSVWLGSGWGNVVSVLWIFGAMQVMKLLGGLGGAAVLLLLITSAVLLWDTVGTAEHVLRTITVLVSGTCLGALPFYFMRNGLELRGSAMSVAGYLFALLTVLARQKAATAVLVLVPLAAVLIAGVGLAIVIMDKGIKPGKK